MTYRYRVATVFLFGFFIDCINIFMPAVALPRISSDFAVGSAASAWVANAYMLGLTLVIPLSTWLAGRCGARQVLATSMLAFAISAWGCGQASSFAALVAWRLAQGMAGGLLIPLGQALTFNLFQGAERARVSTLVMAVALLAPALSPSVGGLIVDRYSWPWVFHANLPLALLTAALAWAWIGRRPVPGNHVRISKACCWSVAPSPACCWGCRCTVPAMAVPCSWQAWRRGWDAPCCTAATTDAMATASSSCACSPVLACAYRCWSITRFPACSPGSTC